MAGSGARQPILATVDEGLVDARATERVGALLAPRMRAGMVVTLSGALGAGKTTLVRAVLRAAGVQGRIKSPSYALVEVYEASNLYWYHFDFYRIGDPREIEASGLREYFRKDSICLVEWPERVPGGIGPVDLELMLEFGADRSGDTRRLHMAGRTETGVQLVREYETARRNG